jgi:hypothetical protein
MMHRYLAIVLTILAGSGPLRARQCRAIPFYAAAIRRFRRGDQP